MSGNSSAEPAGGGGEQQPDDFSSIAHLDGRSYHRLEDNSYQGNFDHGKQEPDYDPVQLAPVRLPSFMYCQSLHNYGYDKPPPSLPSPAQYDGTSQYGSNTASQLGGSGASGQLPVTNRLAAAYSPQWAAYFAEEPKPPPRQPNSYLAWSIVSLLCCCMPLGMAALVFSSDVKSEYAAGRYAQSERKSSTAFALNVIATVLGVIIIIVVGVLYGKVL